MQRLRGAELRPGCGQTARYKWIARKFARRQRARGYSRGDSKKDRIFAPRNAVPWRTAEKVVARCDATRRVGRGGGGGRRERGGGWWTPLLKSAAANDATTIRLSPIKYRGSAQNISAVSRIFLRRVRWRLAIETAREKTIGVDAGAKSHAPPYSSLAPLRDSISPILRPRGFRDTGSVCGAFCYFVSRIFSNLGEVYLISKIKLVLSYLPSGNNVASAVSIEKKNRVRNNISVYL